MTATDVPHNVPIWMNRELKACDHFCCPSTLQKCCSCEDLRPISDTGGYDSYVDGQGWTTTAARDDGYCPVCNTKNYDKWMTRVQEETERKRRHDEEKQRIEQEQQLVAEEDRVKNTDKKDGTLAYSNGNVYVGALKDGEPHGLGRMDYADNDDDILHYEGEWVNGKHQGRGKKLWRDNLWYEGEWYEGMMHGEGICHMNEVDELKGRFEEDEFQD
jgi:hypothetical protein